MDELIRAMTSKGHSVETAKAAIAGRGYEDLAREYLGAGATGTGSTAFSFDLEAEIEKAYEELGEYYNEILEESKGDMNLALSRLAEDYETGKRFRRQDFTLSQEAIDIAQEDYSQDAQRARRNLRDIQLARGITRQSAFEPVKDQGGLGIADVERQRLEKGIGLGEQRLDLRRRGLETNLEQSEELARLEKQRLETDIPEKQKRYERDISRARKLEAGDIATQRYQRAFQRFQTELL